MSRETRQRIVEAAMRVLARDGFAAASVKDIAAEAGVAPGLLHYYFRSKEELVAAAVTECFKAPLIPPGAGDPTAAALAAIEEVKKPSPEHELYHRLFVEVLGPATRDQALRAPLLEAIRRDRGVIEDAARAVIAQREHWPLAQAPVLAAVFWAAFFGIQVQGHLDPEFDMNQAIDTLMELVLR